MACEGMVKLMYTMIDSGRDYGSITKESINSIQNYYYDLCRMLECMRIIDSNEFKHGRRYPGWC